MATEGKVVELQFLEPLMLTDVVADKTVVEVKTALDNNTPVDQTNELGQTGLHIACELGKSEIVSLLISSGANIEAKDLEGITPLISASRNGSLTCVQQLVEAGADVHILDDMEWTALMWACYKGHADVVQAMLMHGANVHSMVAYNMTALLWASGRGHKMVVKMLLDKGAKVNPTDKFGSTPLIWAARRGFSDIVSLLLEFNADINAVGAGGANALITAVKNGYEDIVEILLKRRGANVNHIDQNSSSALTYASRMGETNTIMLLLNAGAYLNLANKNGQTPLIKAVKHGHLKAVKALLSRYADVDIRGKENSTALHYACERGHIGIVKEILTCNPEVEAVNDTGDTPLLLAVKSKNLTITRLLLDKGAAVSATDKKKDTPLHIAIRARSVRIASVLLRKPQDARILYQPNKAGETPYNLDALHNKSILATIFGSKNLSPESQLHDVAVPVVPGNYDLYSCALADILSEPTLTPPLTVGLYAKWGSGKSLLLRRLEKQMQLFTSPSKLQPLKKPGWVSFVVMFFVSSFFGLLCAAFSPQPMRLFVGVLISGVIFSIYLLVMGLILVGVSVGHWNWAKRLGKLQQRQFAYLSLLFKLWFMVPPAPKQVENDKAIPVRFLFTNYNRLTSVGGQTSLAEMIGLLCRSAEKNLGFLAVRLYRPFQDDLAERGQKSRFRRICCLPAFVYVIVFIICFALILIFTVSAYGPYPGLVQNNAQDDNGTELSTLTVIDVSLILLSTIDIGILLIGASTIIIMCSSLLWSQRKRVLNAAHHTQSQERLIQQLKQEVDLLCQTVIAIDAFTNTQTRMVVTINGLDSCEQDKILQVLDTVNVLFSQRPYITILSIDPVIISKAIHGSLNSAFRDADITGHDYLKNVIHLPFFLRERARKLRKLCSNDDNEQSGAESVKDETEGSRKSSHTMKSNHSLRRYSGSRRSIRGTDLGKMMFNEDWFNSMSPQLMKRVLHIVTLTGRLLRADDVEFSWTKLAAWINLTEQWPYRTSFLLFILEKSDSRFLPTDSLRSIYEKNSHLLNPNDPKLVIDSLDELSFCSFVSGRSISFRDVCDFLPATVNLDPKLFDPFSIFGHSPLSGKSSMNHERIASVGAEMNKLEVTNAQPFDNLTPASTPSNIAAVVINTEPVERMSVEDVACKIYEIKGLTRENASKYANFVTLNNINGAALLACDLDELKKELFAPFGDWCLLKQWIQRMKSNTFQDDEAGLAGHTPPGESELADGFKDSMMGSLSLDFRPLRDIDRTAYNEAFKDYLRLQPGASSDIDFDMQENDHRSADVTYQETLRSCAQDTSTPRSPVTTLCSASDACDDCSLSNKPTETSPLLILHSHAVTPQ